MPNHSAMLIDSGHREPQPGTHCEAALDTHWGLCQHVFNAIYKIVHFSRSAVRAHGVVVSHPLRMRKALGSNPSVSILHIVLVRYFRTYLMLVRIARLLLAQEVSK